MKPRSASSVGIFFLVGQKLFIDSTAMDRAENYGDHLIHESDHIAYWADLVKRGDVPDVPYEEHPRGRVAYHTKRGKFTLLADKCILRKKAVVKAIVKRMQLPIKDTETGKDSHYECFRCLRSRKTTQ